MCILAKVIENMFVPVNIEETQNKSTSADQCVVTFMQHNYTSDPGAYLITTMMPSKIL